MKISTLICGLAVASSAAAWPSMEGGQHKRHHQHQHQHHKLMDSLKKRATPSNVDPFEEDSFQLLGDLVPTFNGNTGGPKTAVGWAVWGILTASSDPQSTRLWTGDLPKLGSAKCKADTCCTWRHIALEMEKKFRGKSGRCTAAARAAVRLGFHDAGTWSLYTEDYGGADGSIILSGLTGQSEDELTRGENRGLQNISAIMTGWYNKYKPHGAGMADLIQMGANVAAVVCPLGPRTRSFVGRKDSNRPAVHGLLPDVFAEADVLVDLFENKTIRAHGLTALVGAHTTSQQHFVNTSRAGDPQDSTPGIWDVTFYSETIGNAPERVFRFPSDVKLSNHPMMASEWREFASGQAHWNEVCPGSSVRINLMLMLSQDYAKEYVRLSLLGVNNINSLTECSHVLPPRTDKVSLNENPKAIQDWLHKKGGAGKKTSQDIEDGETVDNVQN